MRLLTFEKAGRPALGIARGERVIDLGALDPDTPADWAAVFAEGGLERLRGLAANVPEEQTVPRDGLHLLPPIPAPPKILCVGLNYMAHAQETGSRLPTDPIFFTRFPSTLVGDGEAMVCPRASEQFDYEGELVAVIGREGRHIPKERALEHVVGYSIFNDGSLRDFQKKGRQWTLGKNFDATGGFGPEIVTSDELPAAASGLSIQTRLNGEVVQDGRTDDLIFDIPTLIATASEVMTLQPGTIIVTGTPPGVGMAREPQLWMKAGDVVSVTIEGIGTLSNPIIDEHVAG
ncbi:fumarylacetoacetate hydrolase family protein [Ferruginivarius sediminum]|uniref:FAA hydrolase family protein n=1 Tax=Ferruginivarius sediminum TaxID=2661937 RepID=A0A369T5A7_9PROT|nr:fumarylacetoacetate hydrolase family protein [Ferruginivarius sediminum]RDD60521.1 FAA hydrolase family protein [Ferruginivarius sediminum]